QNSTKSFVGDKMFKRAKAIATRCRIRCPAKSRRDRVAGRWHDLPELHAARDRRHSRHAWCPQRVGCRTHRKIFRRSFVPLPKRVTKPDLSKPPRTTTANTTSPAGNG